MYGFMDNYFGNVGRRNGLFEQFGMPYGNRQYGGQQQQGNQGFNQQQNIGFNPQQPQNITQQFQQPGIPSGMFPIPAGGYRPIGNGTPGTTTQQFLQNQMNQQGGQPRDGNEANLWKYLSTHKDPTGPSGNGPTPGRPGRDQFGMPIGYADPILPWGFGGG